MSAVVPWASITNAAWKVLNCGSGGSWMWRSATRTTAPASSSAAKATLRRTVPSPALPRASIAKSAGSAIAMECSGAIAQHAMPPLQVAGINEPR